MRHVLALVVGLLVFGAGAAEEPEETAPPQIQTGVWAAWLQTPGGRLPFNIEFARDNEDGLAATIINGQERVKVPTVSVEETTLVLGFDQYDSKIVAKVDPSGRTLEGQWSKPGRDGAVTTLGFQGKSIARLRRASGGHFDRRYSVSFSESGPAVAEFRFFDNGVIHGTFLTPTGDYRYLCGFTGRAAGLTLGGFDGAHAFLFKAGPSRSPEYDLLGDFWSGQTWHERWRAKLDPNASLPDPFSQTRASEEPPDLSELVYTDLQGRKVSLADLKKTDRPMVVEVFGTWCPNCHDEAAHLVELQKEYRKAGLVIVGLAFELNDDTERSIRQVERYRDLHEVNYPLLIAGKAESATVTERVPLIDELHAYPTTIFIDAKGKVRAIYTGYSGPATGEVNRRLRAGFDRVVREMLDEVIK